MEKKKKKKKELHIKTRLSQTSVMRQKGTKKLTDIVCMNKKRKETKAYMYIIVVQSTL